MPTLDLRSEDGSLRLIEGTDYEFVGIDGHDGKTISQLEDGEYYAVYRGIGNYEGRISMWFRISSLYSLASASIELKSRALIAAGKEVTPEVVVCDCDGIELGLGQDYELVYYDEDGKELSKAPAQAGRYKVAAKAKKGGKYSGTTDSCEFRIYAASGSSVKMEAGRSQSVSLKSGMVWTGSFTAAKEGFYEFSSTGDKDSYGMIYEDAEYQKLITQDDDGGDGYNFDMKVRLTEGQTVYLAARAYSLVDDIDLAVQVNSLSDKDLALGMLQDVSEESGYVVTGDYVIPKLMVLDGSEKQLTENKDYTLSYAYYTGDGYKAVDKIDKAGEYRVSAVAKSGSGYTGRTDELNIQAVSVYDMSRASVKIAGPVFAGDDVTKAITVTDRAGRVLKSGTDYKLVFYLAENGLAQPMSSIPTETGEYYARAIAIGDKYTGSTYRSLQIKDRYDLSKRATIRFTDADGAPVYLYTGSQIKPSIEVYDQSGDEIDASCYTVSYADNTAATSRKFASVTITGKSPYTGSVTSYFEIVDIKDLSALKEKLLITMEDGERWAVVSDTVSVDLGDWTAQPKVKIDGGSFVQGVDYIVSYADGSGKAIDKLPKKTGRYQLIIKAGSSGKLKGTVTSRLILTNHNDVEEEPDKPQPVSLEKAVVTLGATSYTYDGNVKAPGVKSVKLNGTTLKENVDYKVTVPAGRQNAGTYTYVVTGIGSYTGTAKAGFVIGKAASSISLTAQTKYYTGSALAYSGTVTKYGSTGAVTYAYYSDTACTKAVAAANVKAAGTYYVRATVAADTNYNAATSLPVEFKVICKGWQQIGKKWYYFKADGTKTTGWKKLGKWYYFDKDGAMVTGWKKLGKWYYFDKSGAMVTGWKKLGKWYYFKKDGAMAANEYCKGYWLNKDGAWTYQAKAVWKKDSKGWYYIDSKKWYAKSCKLTIDGKKYTFDSKGYLK